MNNLRNTSGVNFITMELICLYVILFNLSIFAQPGIQLINTFNPSTPLKLCYQNQNDKIEATNIASDNQSAIFIPLQGGRVEKLNLIKNSVSWISELGGEIVSDLILEDKRIYLITKISRINFVKEDEINKGAVSYILWSLDAETGVTNWQFPFISKGFVFLNSYQDQIFLTEKDGEIISIRKFDGQKIWNKNLLQRLSSPPSLFENKIYISTSDNSILTVTADSGKIISKLLSLQSPATNLITDGNKLYWGEKNGSVNLTHTLRDSRIWSVRYGGEISSLNLTRNGVLVTSLDNFVYLISLQKGKKIWKRRLAGRISVKPLVAGEFIIFVTPADSNAVVLDLRNGRIINKISIADKGFILSAPRIVHNLLVFSTNKGIFAFAQANIDCSQK